MRKNILIFITLLPFMAFAKGGGGGSEYFYQADAGQHDVTPFLTSHSVTQETEGGGKRNIDTFVLGAEYEYGWMEGLSVGAQLSYVTGSYETNVDADISGLQNLEGFVKGSHATGPGLLKYGALLSLSPGNSEVETNGDTNGYTGGNSLEPYVGYEMSSNACTYGARLAFSFGLGDRTQENAGGNESKFSGSEPTTISAFYEHDMSDAKIGGLLDYATVSDLKDEDTGAETEALSPQIDLSVYGRWNVATGQLIPKLTYGFTTDDETGGAEIDDYSKMDITVSFRMPL